MKNLIQITLILFVILGVSQFAFSNKTKSSKDIEVRTAEQLQQAEDGRGVEFIENRGQFADDQGRVRKSVLFRAKLPGAFLYITERGLTYFFAKAVGENADEYQYQSEEDEEALMAKIKGKVEEVTVYWDRVDISFAGANIQKANVVKSLASQDYFNYYYAHCPDGILNVRSYGHIIIKDIYPGIDWEILSNGTLKKGFKTNFLVDKGVDYKQIKMKLTGSEHMAANINKNKMYIKTSLGEIEEYAPVAYAGKNELGIEYTKLNDNTIGFEVPGYNGETSLIIDPIAQLWSTYYGGNAVDGYVNGAAAIHSDGTNVFLTGTTGSTNFPVLDAGGGAYYVGSSVGNYDICILKFNTDGVRQWATYYGGTSWEQGFDIMSDGTNVFIIGRTFSSDLPTLDAGGGAYYQAAKAGGRDGFILKFNVAGVSQWATYYGGTGEDEFHVLHTDGTKLWIVGETNSNADFPRIDPGGGAYYQAFYGGGGRDQAILRFTVAGVREWATFYGGNYWDIAYAVCVDGTYLWVGGAANATAMPTTDLGGGAYYQTTNFGGGWGGTILRFDQTTSAIQWATFYSSQAGSNSDFVWGIQSDGVSKVWMYMQSQAPAGTANLPIVDPGGGAFMQTTNGGGVRDIYIVEFDYSGITQWATYYGGGLNEEATGFVYRDGVLWFGGDTYSTDFPTTDAADGSYFQLDPGDGTEDLFLMKIDAATRAVLHATYVGGVGHDETETGRSISVDGNALWLTGYANDGNFPLTVLAGAWNNTGSLPLGQTEMHIGKYSLGAALPITLTSFTGENKGDVNVLEWLTATEINNDYFTLERSTDGKNFTPIAVVNGAGNSNNSITYNYTDDDLSANVYYYRLKQTDFDGEFAYSKIVVISVKGKLGIELLPNPAINEVEIAIFGNKKAKVELVIVNVLGQVVHDKVYQETANKFKLDISSYNSGVYFVTVRGNGQSVMSKIIKQQ